MERESDGFVCISCGSKVTSLWKDFGNGIINSGHCGSCGQVADKYVECDGVLVFLNVLLHRKEAYRHILYNSVLELEKPIIALSLLSVTYMKWIYFRHICLPEEVLPSYSDVLLEFQFYYFLASAATEQLIFVFVVLGSVWLTSRKRQALWTRTPKVARALLLSGYGKLFLTPALVWTKETDLKIWFIYILILSSSSVALKICGPWSIKRSFPLVCIGTLCSAAFHMYSMELTMQQWRYR